MKKALLFLLYLMSFAFADDESSEKLCETTLVEGDHIFFALGNFMHYDNFCPLEGVFHIADDKTNFNYPSCFLEIHIEKEDKDKGILNLEVTGGVTGKPRRTSYFIFREGINFNFDNFPKKINYGPTIVKSSDEEDEAYLLIYRAKSMKELKENVAISDLYIFWEWRLKDLAFSQRLEEFHRVHNGGNVAGSGSGSNN